MGKNLFIAEKPSVAKEFAKALKLNNLSSKDGYMESDEAIVTWCVGHLVTMSYPEAYDEKLKRWAMDTIPFIPKDYKYEIIPSVNKQFQIVKGLLTREDVETIYVCTDSGREGEYIYRLVDQEAHVVGKNKKRVWIDSQTEEEINRGIREAKDLSCYDSLADAAYLRAKEDYLMGINFSRVLTLRYGNNVKDLLKRDKGVISVGRVMTCVLGMVVSRENEIRKFVETPFYRVLGNLKVSDSKCLGEWRQTPGSIYEDSPKLYKENGFSKEEDAKALISYLENSGNERNGVVKSIESKKEPKNPPLLFNLAELQNECSKLFKISPDETLQIIQDLYEKKLVTYPRTDARVLSTAVSKEIHKNIQGLMHYAPVANYASFIYEKGGYKGLSKSKYVNDKQITDHYAIIPTGQGMNNLSSMNELAQNVYEVIVRRFLAIFLPPAVYRKISLTVGVNTESFFFNFRALESEGFLALMNYSFSKKKETSNTDDSKEEEAKISSDDLLVITSLKKGDTVSLYPYEIKEGKTSPPKRYNSGSMILAMENAGQLIEDEELRSQIKGSGIGTSATRAEILKKLVNIEYLNLNKKTQVLTPTLLGETVYWVVIQSIPALLQPELTANWEMGLDKVANGELSSDEYMEKMGGFVVRRTNYVKETNRFSEVKKGFLYSSAFYKK